MAFQPFGYRFEVTSTKSPSETKAALRSDMKSWFEPKKGPRGWILGPFVCLWQSAFDQHGPMVFARISRDGFGTRVAGRAGSNLNGMVVFGLLFGLLTLGMAFIAYQLIENGLVTRGAELIPAAVFLLPAGLLAFWFAHKDRRQAEPLVNFVRRSLGASPAPLSRRALPDPTDYLAMRLIVGGDQESEMIATPDAIRDAVAVTNEVDGGFIVLQRADQHFMQAGANWDGFVLEKREGGDTSHFVAKRADGDHSPFSKDEIAAALIGYLGGRGDPGDISWESLLWR